MKITMQDITVIIPNGSKMFSSSYQVLLRTPLGNDVALTPSNDIVEATIENDEIPALPEVQPLLTEVVQQLLADGQKFNAIKAVKDATGCGLKPAKLFVDGFLPYESQPTITERVKELLSAGRYNDAFYLFRDFAGCDSDSTYAFINAIQDTKPAWLREVENLILIGKFIDAIKLYRKSTDSSLLDAKNACDAIRDNFRDRGMAV